MEPMLGVTVVDAQGVVTDLLQKLGSKDGPKWLDATKKFLRCENPWTTMREQFSVWKIVQLKKISLEYLKELLGQRGMRIRCDDTKNLLQKTISAMPDRLEREVEFVVMSVRELGLTQPDWHEVAQRSASLGLHLCPPEAAIALRLQYIVQPVGQHYVLAMNTLDPVNALMFVVGHDSVGRYIGITTSKGYWASQDIFVFMRPKLILEKLN